MAKIIAVASGKGGVGKSSVTAGVGLSLAKNGFKTLVLDFDIGLRSLDVMLDVSEMIIFDWGDLLLDRCSAEQAIVDCDGLSFLAAPQNFAEEFTAQAVTEMVQKLAQNYDYVLIDAPAGVSGGFSLACLAAEQVLLVTTPDNVCLRTCSYTAKILRSMGVKDIRLIINRFASRPVCKGKLLNIDDCIDISTVQLFGIVPEDSQIVYSSVLARHPEEYSPSASAYERIAARIAGRRIPLVVE